MAIVPTTTITPLPVRQQIKYMVAETLGEINTGNGYTQDVTEVYLDQRGQVQVKSFPAISIIDRGDRDTRLVQGVYEARLLLELRTVIEDFDRSTRGPEVAQLAADAMRAIMSKENAPLGVWNGLAVQTLLQSADLHDNDAQDPTGLVFLIVEILYRVQQNNPYQMALL